MGRKKKEEIKRDSNSVGRGCLDCVGYGQPMNKSPCKDCRNWSGWEPNEAWYEVRKLRSKLEKMVEKGQRWWEDKEWRKKYAKKG